MGGSLRGKRIMEKMINKCRKMGAMSAMAALVAAAMAMNGLPGIVAVHAGGAEAIEALEHGFVGDLDVNEESGTSGSSEITGLPVTDANEGPTPEEIGEAERRGDGLMDDVHEPLIDEADMPECEPTYYPEEERGAGGLVEGADAPGLESTGASDLPAKYMTEKLTPVRDQSGTQWCRGYATLAAMEASAIKHAGRGTGIQYNVSQLAALEGAAKGDMLKVRLNAFIAGVAPIDSTKPSSTRDYSQRGLDIRSRRDIRTGDVGEVKRLIMECGGVVGKVMSDTDYGYVGSNKTYFYSPNEQVTHAVCLVGWDDSVSRTNFSSTRFGTPAGDGAFIFKDSHGTGRGDKGYAYVSYYCNALFSGYRKGSGADFYAYETADDPTLTQRLTGKETASDMSHSPVIPNATHVAKVLTMDNGMGRKERIVKIAYGVYTPGTYRLSLRRYSDSSKKPWDQGTADYQADVVVRNTGFDTLYLPDGVTYNDGDRVAVTIERGDGGYFHAYAFGDGKKALLSDDAHSDSASSRDDASFCTNAHADPLIVAYTETTDSPNDGGAGAGQGQGAQAGSGSGTGAGTGAATGQSGSGGHGAPAGQAGSGRAAVSENVIFLSKKQRISLYSSPWGEIIAKGAEGVSGTPIFTVINDKVAKVSKKGVVKARKGGATVITVHTKREDIAKFKIIVLSLPKKFKGSVGAKISLSGNMAGAEYGAAWSSSNAAVAEVDANGTVTGVSPGKARITATIGNASCSTMFRVR